MPKTNKTLTPAKNTTRQTTKRSPRKRTTTQPTKTSTSTKSTTKTTTKEQQQSVNLNKLKLINKNETPDILEMPKIDVDINNIEENGWFNSLEALRDSDKQMSDEPIAGNWVNIVNVDASGILIRQEKIIGVKSTPDGFDILTDSGKTFTSVYHGYGKDYQTYGLGYIGDEDEFDNLRAFMTNAWVEEYAAYKDLISDVLQMLDTIRDRRETIPPSIMMILHKNLQNALRDDMDEKKNKIRNMIKRRNDFNKNENN